MIHDIEASYIRLLADVGRIAGLPEIRGSAYMGLHWCVYDAPKLEKQLLDHIEHKESFNGFTEWPGWLIRLRDRFIMNNSAHDLLLLRQLLLFCYKAQHKHTNETEIETFKNWRSVNSNIGTWGERINAQPPALLDRVIKHCTSVLGNTNWKEIVPFHGPGAVYDRNMNKGAWSKVFETIDHCYPYHDYFCVNKGFDTLTYPEVESNIDARMIAVPKDSRGPRLICVHPTEAVWIQQGVRIKMEKAIARRRNYQQSMIWPNGHIHFNDQTRNRELALVSSATEQYATLDLKEASDRLSDLLVQAVMGRHYRWFGCSRAHTVTFPLARSKRASVEGERVGAKCQKTAIDGGSIQAVVNCFAPMGNALTFPVQSLVFWGICVSSIESRGLSSPWDVSIVGDDIIVPNIEAPYIMEDLESFGLLVNRRKSFHKGLFRESCGMDAFNGFDVTPIRWKTDYTIRSATGLLALCSLAQRLRSAGYYETSTYMYDIVKYRLSQRGLKLFKTNNEKHGGIAELVTDKLSRANAGLRQHKYLHKPVTKLLRLRECSNAHAHGRNHVLSSLSSLLRTGLSNDPARAPSYRSVLEYGWADHV